MGKKKSITTNAMRILKASKIDFEVVEYEIEGEISKHFGEEISRLTGIPPEKSFKTLVAKGEKMGIIVVVIPVNCEVNLKSLASAIGDKRVELVPVKEIPKLTGYIRGGVSPIGMTKKYPTYIESSCMDFDKIAVSGGLCGYTILLSPGDLIDICDAKLFKN